jgi:catechol 2,3-dioxygenase
MTQGKAVRAAANLKLSHMGLAVRDMALVERFYVEVLGFTVTDRGEFGAMQVVFMSRDPEDHHQIVLATGRPAVLPANEFNPDFGPSLIQISFKMRSLADLRDMKDRLQSGGATRITAVNHGNAWSVYANDPEGNYLEFFMDTEWYAQQPFYVLLDLDRPDEEIVATTRALCEASPGFKSLKSWRTDMAKVMAPPYKP